MYLSNIALKKYKKQQVMDLVVKENFVLHERRISLSEFHAADEVWYFTYRYQLCIFLLKLCANFCAKLYDLLTKGVLMN